MTRARATLSRLRRSMRPIWLSALTAVCLFALAACDRNPSTSSKPATTDLRIVSLSPAISRTLVDLGLAGRIVGRTPYCASLDQSVPVVGDLQNINYEELVRLKPTHILVQPPAAGVDTHLQEIAQAHAWIIADWHLDTVNDVRALVRDIPQRLFAQDSPQREEIEAHAGALLARIDSAVGEPTSAADSIYRGRVLLVEAVNPVLAFGAGTYLDDVLRSLAGENAVSDRGWVQLSLEDIVRLAPDAIILVKPGGAEADLARDLGPLATIDVPAVKEHRLALLNHGDALLPSSGVIGVAEQMRSILRRFAGGSASQDNRP